MKSVNLVSLNAGPNKGRVEVEQVPGAKQAVACLFVSVTWRGNLQPRFARCILVACLYARL